MTLPRALRTLRHVRPGQLWARGLHEAWLRTLKRAGPLQRARLAPDPAARAAVLHLDGPQGAGLVRAREVATLFLEGRVRHLAREGDRDDWTAPGFPRLWRYERQYHSELVSLAALAQREPRGPWLAEAAGLVERWARACPPAAGDGWEPYPVARRVLSWAEAMALAEGLRAPLAPLLLPQLRFLAAHLEWHLLGNHLLCDAAALVAGAAALEGQDQLFALGARLLVRELRRQVLPDGGFAERAPLYHALVARDALLSLRLARQRGMSLPIEDPAARMLRWLGQVRRAEGELPCLNDSTPAAARVAQEALALGLQLDLLDAGDVPADLQLAGTGWTILREGRHELLFEHGPIGPPEQPGHGHADALSFELIWDGELVVCDSGVSTYERGAVRDFERSARAHATVTVEGEGADETWASFRVGGRAQVECGPVTHEGPARRVWARARSFRGWVHERRIAFTPGEALRIDDRVAGARGEIIARLPFAPGFQPGRSVQLVVARGERLADEPGTLARGFGVVLPRPVACVRADREGRIEVVFEARR